jgi:hypothetical protein
MGKIRYYKEQAKAFTDYASKFLEKDVVKVFNEWVASKDFSGKDREGIWRIVRKSFPIKEKIIKEGDEGYMRLSAVLEILYQNDLKRLKRLLEKMEKDIDKT